VKKAPSGVPFGLLASAAAIMITTYIHAIVTGNMRHLKGKAIRDTIMALEHRMVSMCAHAARRLEQASEEQGGNEGP
jgi:hypothetical protein